MKTRRASAASALRRSGWFGALAVAALVAACSSGSDPDSGDGYSSCPAPPMSCPSPAPSWMSQVQPIINARCALGGQCHGPGGAEESMYNYTSYAGVKKNYITMDTEVAGCLMPPADAVAPTNAEWVTLLEWFNCGAPDN